MASRSICATVVVVFAVVSGTTDTAVTPSGHSCNELDVTTCLERNAKSITRGSEANNISAFLEKICRGNVKTCTGIHPLDKCPEEYRTRILALENSLMKASDALCEKDGALLKAVIEALYCWSFDDIESCVAAINIPAPKLDLLTHKRRQQDWDHFNAELSKCIDRAREDTQECKAADFGPLKKLIDIFFTQSPPLKSGSGVTSPVSTLTALVSLIVSLALSR